MEAKINYQFSAALWKYEGKGSWYFIALPKRLSNEIRKNNFQFEEGWGRLKVIAAIKNIEWKTAIWFDSKKQTYLLPIKAEIRQKERIKEGDTIAITLKV